MRRSGQASGARRWAAVAAAVASLLAGVRASALVGGQYDPATNSVNNAVVINDQVGASTFYNYGDFFGNLYHNFGGQAVVANIEGGSVWNGHDTLGQVTTYLPAGTPPAFANHATGVGMVIAGGRADLASTTLFEAGIAPGATLWSGNIGSNVDAATGSFEIDEHRFVSVYRIAMKTGVGGVTADVVNSSWGSDPADGLTSNNHFYAVAIDALAAQTGKTVVFAAGNSGPGANTVSSPATSYNSIVVGAAGYSVTSPYTTVASFSSRSPTDGFVPTSAAVIADANATPPGTLHPGARAAVSILAPGENLFPAYYDATDPTQTGLYAIEAAGTSYAAPIVAGGAALLVDTGRTWFAATPQAVDARLVKAVLMNSADKTPGWDNGQVLTGGVVRTTQALDYAAGTGTLNLTKAFTQYLNGSQTVDETGVGGPVLTTGWAYGLAHAGAPTDYAMLGPIDAGSKLTVTLDWFVNSLLADDADAPSFGSFANLDLQVWHMTDGLADHLVAESASEFENVEHLSFDLPDTGEYLLRVLWNGELYDLVDAPDQAPFGLAWDTAAPVPEPGIVGLMAAVALLLAGRRRRRQSL